MRAFEPGDIVRKIGREQDMLVISQAENAPRAFAATAYDCVWEQGDRLLEEVVSGLDLILVRRERRRVLRGGILPIPQYRGSDRIRK